MQAMSRKDDCLNHTPMEIFFVFLKKVAVPSVVQKV